MNHTIGEMQKRTSPNPFCLITSGEGENTNLMALSWWTYVSNNPPTVAVCLSQKGHSGTLIKANGQFGLCLAGESIREEALKCGMCSGRSVNKAKELGIELEEASVIAPRLVKGSPAALECKVTQVLPVADHDMFIAQVVEIHVGGGGHLSAFEGYKRLDVAD